MITVVHVRKAPFTLYIGRQCQEFDGSKWHNPWPAQIYGRFLALKNYAAHVRLYLWNDLHELDDQVLGCWCHPKACHGDVLKKLRQEQLDAISRETVPSGGASC
jgi:hypothetical protein